MKTTQLKNLIKEAVREAIQDELKDILLEAVKAPRTIVNESAIPQVNISNKPTSPNVDVKAKYNNIMGALEDTKMSFTSQDAVPMNTMGVDPVNGQLPQGSISLDQIGNLLSST
tara:strand:- start:104 stop:445 length:342 start_codon:yes stop_codon:yes gene_type:complete